jgi:uncharacterized membrane protein (UPF0182 family)
VPELKFVVVVNGDAVFTGGTLDEALEGAVAGVEPDPGEGDGDGDGEVDQTVAELLAEAAQRFEAADAALRDGDLATYEEEIQAAQDLVAQAIELSGAVPADDGAAASPTPSASPTP